LKHYLPPNLWTTCSSKSLCQSHFLMVGSQV